VCLGLIDLVFPHYYDGGVFEHFLLLSWAGRPLSKCINQIDKILATDAITGAFTGLHRLHVLHGDAEPRNILYDAISRSFMVTDFERAQFRGSQPLSSISPNSQGRKRKRGVPQKQRRADFTRELQSVMESVSRCFDDIHSTVR